MNIVCFLVKLTKDCIRQALLTNICPGTSVGQTASADSSVRGYLSSLVSSQDHYYFKDTIADSSARESRVDETVLLILGTWLLSQSYFVPTCQDQRHIVFAYCRSTDREYSEANAFEQPLRTLISKSGLLPNPGEGGGAFDDTVSTFQVIDDPEISEPFPLHSYPNLLESLSIDSNRLNTTNLSTYSYVEIAWTQNISRHMLVSNGRSLITSRYSLFPARSIGPQTMFSPVWAYPQIL